MLPKLKPEVDLRRCCCHFGKSTRRYNSVTYRLIRIKIVGRCRITCRWWQYDQNWNRKYNSNI